MVLGCVKRSLAPIELFHGSQRPAAFNSASSSATNELRSSFFLFLLPLSSSSFFFLFLLPLFRIFLRFHIGEWLIFGFELFLLTFSAGNIFILFLSSKEEEEEEEEEGMKQFFFHVVVINDFSSKVIRACRSTEVER